MKRIMNGLLTGVFFGGLSAMAMASCGEEKGDVYNCRDVCTDYGECANELGTNLDLSQCVANCEAQEATKPDFESALEACQNCIWDAMTCTQELACVSTCAGLIPEAMP